MKSNLDPKFTPPSSPKTEDALEKDWARKDLEYRQKVAELESKITILEKEIEELEKEEAQKESSPLETEEKIEAVVAEAEEQLQDENEKAIDGALLEQAQNLSDEKVKSIILAATKKQKESLGKKIKRKIKKYAILYPLAIIFAAVQQAPYVPPAFYTMAANWKDRHIDKKNKNDPSIKGIDALYNDTTINRERSTYDYLGKETIPYEFGYYRTSVFDLTNSENKDHTPPHFKLINSRDFDSTISNAAGITTNFLNEFRTIDQLTKELQGGKETSEEIAEVPVIAYNTKNLTMKAGHLKEFNKDWIVSPTNAKLMDFQLNPDGTIPIVYDKIINRKVPVMRTENGEKILFQIGVMRDTDVDRINPYEATHFGTLEGGKVLLVCGEKQLQVNGSFADIYRVFQKLKQDYPNTPIYSYLLDNGSYNLPIWTKDSTITPEDLRSHFLRNISGGYALVMINDGAISPYEYKNKYKEVYHHIGGATLDSVTKQPAINKKEVIVIHHTGNYDLKRIISEFSDTTQEKSAHVVIRKDGTREIFNDDNAVLGHAGKSEFDGKEKVNFFSIGVELEGDSKGGQQFTVAQLESLLEYLWPRIQKYNIPLEHITTHKIIRENYMKMHPEDKKVPPKPDLDDKVWQQIRDLIAKKLYNVPQKVGKADIKAHQMLGSLVYQEAYRVSRNKEVALNQVRVALADKNVPEKNINKTVNWITKKLG